MSLTAGPVRSAISGVSALPGPAPTAKRDSSTLQQQTTNKLGDNSFRRLPGRVSSPTTALRVALSFRIWSSLSA